jgi:hypothetical protein
MKKTTEQIADMVFEKIAFNYDENQVFYHPKPPKEKFEGTPEEWKQYNTARASRGIPLALARILGIQGAVGGGLVGGVVGGRAGAASSGSLKGKLGRGALGALLLGGLGAAGGGAAGTGLGLLAAPLLAVAASREAKRISNPAWAKGLDQFNAEYE